MDTASTLRWILQAINDQDISASFYTGPVFTYGHKWKVTLVTKNPSALRETTATGESLDEALNKAWANHPRKDAA